MPNKHSVKEFIRFGLLGEDKCQPIIFHSVHVDEILFCAPQINSFLVIVIFKNTVQMVVEFLKVLTFSTLSTFPLRLSLRVNKHKYDQCCVSNSMLFYLPTLGISLATMNGAW